MSGAPGMILAPTPLRVALFEPRIPPNTGSIARTCAAFGLPLALIEPLGFSIDDRHLKRAGLDYWPFVDLSVHQDFDQFLNSLPQPSRLIGCSRRGGQTLQTMRFQQGDVLLFFSVISPLQVGLQAHTEAQGSVLGLAAAMDVLCLLLLLQPLCLLLRA